MDAIKDVIRAIKADFLSEDQVKSFGEKVIILLDESLQRRNRNIKLS